MPEWLRWPQWLTRRRAVPLGLVLYLLLRLRLLRLRAGAAAAALAPVIYSSFLGQVQAGEVTKVLLGPATLTFTTAAGAFLTDRFSDETLLPLLLKHKVTFGLAPVARMKKIGPMLVLLVPFIYLGMAAYMMAGIGKGPKGKPVGKRQDRRSPKSSVHFADAGGVDSAKAELMDIVSFIRSPGKYESLGALMPKGALLVGPSGTGKTLLARAVAGECNLPFFSCSASDFVEVYVSEPHSTIYGTRHPCGTRYAFAVRYRWGWVRPGFGSCSTTRAQVRAGGQTTRPFRQVYLGPGTDRALALAAKPAIVFIDEIDAVGAIRSEGGRAGGANDERCAASSRQSHSKDRGGPHWPHWLGAVCDSTCGSE